MSVPMLCKITDTCQEGTQMLPGEVLALLAAGNSRSKRGLDRKSSSLAIGAGRASSETLFCGGAGRGAVANVCGLTALI